ncbi:hypothetical protein J3F84DRAFT_358402 [Trichoderma pleuroticola]
MHATTSTRASPYRIRKCCYPQHLLAAGLSSINPSISPRRCGVCIASRAYSCVRLPVYSYACKGSRSLSRKQVGSDSLGHPNRLQGPACSDMHRPIAIRGQRHDKAEKGKCLHRGNERQKTSPVQIKSAFPLLTRIGTSALGILTRRGDGRSYSWAYKATPWDTIQLIHPLTPLNCWTGKPGSVLCKGPEVFSGLILQSFFSPARYLYSKLLKA